MTTTPPRGRRLAAAQRRAVIEAEAAQLFARRGFEGTTIDDVAAACGVTKPIVYRHFASKKALYLALLDQHREQFPRFFERVAADLPPRERFEAILDGWLSYVAEHGYAWQMLFRDSTGDEEIRAYREQVKDAARATLAAFIAAQAQAPIAEREVEPLAELVRSAGVGLALYAIDHPDTPRSALAGAAMRIFDGLAQTTR